MCIVGRNFGLRSFVLLGLFLTVLRAPSTAWAGLFGPESRASLVCRQSFALPSLIDTAPSRLRIFQESRSLSQQLRDNAPDYWHYARLHGPKSFGPLLKYRGLVVGDTHPGNFIISQLAGDLRFFIADVKDSGYAPFILDFARLIVSTHVIFDDVKTKETVQTLFEAYVKGLRGEPFKASKEIRDLFKTDLEDYNQKTDAYVAKKTNRNRFILKPGKLESFSDLVELKDPAKAARLKSDMIQAIQYAFPGAVVSDFALRPRSRGGSASLTRYWALVNVNGTRRIFEFKQIGEPATAQYASQPEPLKRYEAVKHVFWQVEDPSFQVVKLDGDYFQLRPKKVDVFRVPYKQKSTRDEEFLMDLASYDAYYLGQLHARQEPSGAYLSSLRVNERDVRRALKRWTKDYADHLRASLEALSSKNENDDD